MTGHVVSVSWLALCQYVACKCKERTSRPQWEKGVWKDVHRHPSFFFLRFRTSRIRKFAVSPQEYKYNTPTFSGREHWNCLTSRTGLRAIPQGSEGKRNVTPYHTCFWKRKKNTKNVKGFFLGGGGGVNCSRIFAYRGGFWNLTLAKSDRWQCGLSTDSGCLWEDRTELLIPTAAAWQLPIYNACSNAK